MFDYEFEDDSTVLIFMQINKFLNEMSKISGKKNDEFTESDCQLLDDISHFCKWLSDIHMNFEMVKDPHEKMRPNKIIHGTKQNLNYLD